MVNMIFTACDSNYFNKFAIPLAISAREFNEPLYITVINPNVEALHNSVKLMGQCPGIYIMNTEVPYLDGFTEEQRRVFYSTARFHFGSRLIKEKSNIDNVLIVDTDCLLNSPIKWDMGTDNVKLFFRDPLPNCNEWETFSTHVAAGIVQLGRGSEPFSKALSVHLKKFPHIWFVDQASIYQAYLDTKNTVKFGTFTLDDMDWEFLPKSMIWTGKGNRKYENKTYLAKQEHYMSMFK